MEYVNPTSIAQMFQRPQDSSIPGSGYGLLQGFLEGQAAADSRRFLEQSQAAQAQDFVKQQFDMQKSWADRPYDLEKRGVELDNLRNTGQGQKLTNRGTELANEDALLARNLKSQALLGSHYETMSQLKSPLERKQFWDALIQKTRFGGYPRMDDLIYDGSEESWQNALAAVQAARDSSLYQNQLAAQLEMTNRKEAGDTSRTTQTNQTSMRNVNAKNATDLAIARLRADVDRATQGGGNAWNAFREQLGRDWTSVAAKFKRGQKLDPAEEAILEIAPQVLAGGFASTQLRNDPNVAGDVERAKAGARIEGIKDAIKKKQGTVNTEGGEGVGIIEPETNPVPSGYAPPLSDKPEAGKRPTQPLGAPKNKPLPESESELQRRMDKYLNQQDRPPRR